MKTKILYLLLIFSLVSKAQNDDNNIETFREFYIGSNLSFESSSLNGNIIEEIFSGYIDNNLKDRILNLSDDHILNLSFKNNISYSENLTDNIFYNFSFSDITEINAKFDNDLLKLGLKGNYEFQDETLEFENTRIRANRYQQFKLQLEKKNKNSSFGLGLSYVHGNHNFTVISNNASIYTAPMGLYLDLDYDINAFSTDTTDFSLFENNGNGIALDVTGSFNVLNHKFDFYMFDLGYILWDNNSRNIFVDSAYIFQGINIDNVFDFNDSILEISNILDDYDNINEKNNSFKSYLGANIGFKISKEIKGNRFGLITYGLNNKWQPYLDNEKLSFNKIKQGFEESDYKPYYFVRTEVIFNNVSLLPKIGYGGYTNNLNIDLSLVIRKNISFAIGTQHLEFLFDKENTYGTGVYLQIHKAL